MIHQDRLTARFDGDFVVFLIGMRINRPLRVDRWWPVANAMPKMLKELYQHPELGFLHAETWFSRTILVLQYWRSLDQLMDYAKNREAAHLPAWQAFNRSVGTDGSVGIWHETYSVSEGRYENVYVTCLRSVWVRPARLCRRGVGCRVRGVGWGSRTIKYEAIASHRQIPHRQALVLNTL
jgi:hypothetical protein